MGFRMKNVNSSSFFLSIVIKTTVAGPADLEDLLNLMSYDFVHDVIPVGSQGIMHEVNVLAKDSGLRAKLELPELEAKRSAGPATAVVVTVSKNALSRLSGLINKPIQLIGSFCR